MAQQPQMSNVPSQMVYSGPMSYNATFHGSNPFTSTLPSTPFPTLLDPSTLPPEPTYHDISVATHKQIASLQAKLDQKLGPEYVSQRPGPGGGPKLTYAEGWKIINLANEVFGFNGWSSSVCNLAVDYLDPHDEGRRWHCGVSAIVRVTLKDGVYHEDIGYGVVENARSKGAALEKCKKEAITDAIKRTLRNFGNLLGNCLYDKQYAQEIVKIKVQPPKFDRSALYRRPEFEEGSSGKSNSTGSANPPKSAGASVGTASATATKNLESKSMPPPPLPAARGMKCKTEVATPETPLKKEHAAAPVSHHIQANRPPTRPNFPPGAVGSPHVTSTNHDNTPSTDPEEASYFNSDDDALLLQLDMEGDRSMVLEEDRPIDTEGDYDLTANTTIDSVQSAPDVQSHHHGSSIAQNQRQNPGDQQKDCSPNQYQSREQLRISRQEQQQSRHPHPQQSSRPRQPGVASSSRSASPATSAVGGFHFPPGVNPPSRPKPNLPILHDGATRTTGMKRTADDAPSSNSSSDPDSRARSLGQRPSDGRTRESLPLEGGDLKRMRR